MVMVFIPFLDVVENGQRFFSCGWFNKNLLETSFKRSIFFNRITVFVQRRCSNTLYRSSCQCRFHNIGRIHASRCTTGTNQGVYLINKNDDIWILLKFLQQCPDTFFKLSTIFCTGNNGSHIKTYQTFVKQHRRSLSPDYHLCQSFNNCAFTDTWFSNENRIILLSTPQDFDHTEHLLVSTDYRVKLVVQRCLSQIGREIV